MQVLAVIKWIVTIAMAVLLLLSLVTVKLSVLTLCSQLSEVCSQLHNSSSQLRNNHSTGPNEVVLVEMIEVIYNQTTNFNACCLESYLISDAVKLH